MLIALLLLVAGSGAPQIHAVRAAAPPVIDGRLDDAVWQSAAKLERFVQVLPDEGRPASERTEVRLLYDDHSLYVGVRCWDSRADTIAPRLGRRDAQPESDLVVIDVDSQHDRRSAFEFGVNAGGVQADGILTEGQGPNYDWDGVWNVETRIDAQGWTAEFEIPFATLRFPKGSPQTWGFHVSRYISRLKEIDVWNLIRVSDAAQIGRYEELSDLEGVRPGLSLQLIPYVSGTLRGSFEADNLAPRNAMTGQAGFDVKYGLGSLTLDATINPDFAQVEVDPEVVNLSAFETYYPEKRPFFLEGLDIFQTPGGLLLYTRRIGAPPPEPDPQHGGQVVALDPVAPIVGAFKVTGNVRSGTAIGLLGAYVDETHAIERATDGPLGDTWRLQASPPTWFQAARVRQVVGASSTVGLFVTSVVHGSADDPALGHDAHVLALDFDLRGRGDWTASGTAGASLNKACDPTLSVSYHGTGTCDPWGATVIAGKTGGAIQVFDVASYLGTELDVNDLGYAPHYLGTQIIEQDLNFNYVHNSPWRRFKQFTVGAIYVTAWDPNVGDTGDPAPLDNHRIIAYLNGRLRNDWMIIANVNHAFAFSDDVETRRNPIVRRYQRDGAENLSLQVTTDPTRALSGNVYGYANYDYKTSSWQHNETAAATLVGARGRLQLNLQLGWLQWIARPRWVDTGAMSGLPLFGTLDLDQLEIDLRGTFAFTRDLTLQVFSQLLRSSQHYPHLAQLVDPRTFVACDDARCVDAQPAGYYDADLTSLKINAVARWQFQPGSAVYLVWTHNHQIAGTSGRFEFDHALSSLGTGAADNVIALKISYLWAL